MQVAGRDHEPQGPFDDVCLSIISTTTLGFEFEFASVLAVDVEDKLDVHTLDVSVKLREAPVWEAGERRELDKAVDCVNVVAVVVFKIQYDDVTTTSQFEDVTVASYFVLLLLGSCCVVVVTFVFSSTIGSRNSRGNGRFFRGNGHEIDGRFIS